MSKVLTARLDEKSHEELIKLSKALGKTESEIVRESIHLMAATHSAIPGNKSRFVGLGQFASGIADLASNKKHMNGFGRR